LRLAVARVAELLACDQRLVEEQLTEVCHEGFSREPKSMFHLDLGQQAEDYRNEAPRL
jgi:hypothetical protein